MSLKMLDTICSAILLLIMMNTKSLTNAVTPSSTSPNISISNDTKVANLTSGLMSDITISPNASSSTTFSFAQMLKNSSTSDDNTLDNSEAWEESHSEEFLETINNGTLTRGAKVQEVKSQWNTNVGDDEAEATE